jgi:hypothetical protein
VAADEGAGRAGFDDEGAELTTAPTSDGSRFDHGHAHQRHRGNTEFFFPLPYDPFGIAFVLAPVSKAWS